jgi:hypothetical protein
MDQEELLRTYKNEIVTMGSIIEWIGDILDGKEVSDFGLSFPIVRRVYEQLSKGKSHSPEG